MPWRQHFLFGPEYSGSRALREEYRRQKRARKQWYWFLCACSVPWLSNHFPNCPQIVTFSGGVSPYVLFFCREKAFFSFFFFFFFFFFSQSFTSHNPLLFPFSLSLSLSSFSLTFSIIKLFYVTLETPHLYSYCCCCCLSLLSRTFQFVTSLPCRPTARLLRLATIPYYHHHYCCYCYYCHLEFPQIGYPDRFLFSFLPSQTP